MCRRRVFLIFTPLASAEALFFGFSRLRHLPKSYFSDFHSVGGCRNVVFLLEIYEWADKDRVILRGITEINTVNSKMSEFTGIGT